MEEDEIVQLFVQTQAVAFLDAKKRKTEESERKCFNVNYLPDIMMLQIFNFLTPKDLATASQVCRMWNNLSEDELLWRGFLKRDIHKWQMINHSLNPGVFENADILNFKDPERKFSCKEIYWTCKPRKAEEGKEEPKTREDIFTKSLNSLWSFMSRKKTPKVVLYGSGLNSLKGGRKLLGIILGVSSRECSSEFRVTGLVPGGNSVGAGISIEFRGVQFTLITVYNSSKAEREASPDGFEFGRLLIRNFGGGGSVGSDASSRESSPPPVDDDAFAASHRDDASSSATSSPPNNVAKLAPIFHQLFEDADAFVYVTDSCKVADEIAADRAEADAARRHRQLGGGENVTMGGRGDGGGGGGGESNRNKKDPNVVWRPWEDELGILLPRQSHSQTLPAKAAPLLVLACRNSKEMTKKGDEGETQQYASAFEVVQTFQREYLLMGRPWQVNSVDVCDGSGVSDGFHWIVNRCR